MRKFIVYAIITLTIFLPKILFCEPKINDVYVILFILDGGNFEYFDGLIKNGNLPNLKKYFYDEGSYFEHTIASFPSASAPNYQGMVSGLYPGESGINYLAWFDRTKKKEIDYFTTKDHLRTNVDFLNFRAIRQSGDLFVKNTVFEQLETYPTLSSYSTFFKGAARRIPLVPLSALLASANQQYPKLDQLALKNLTDSFNAPVDEIPRFSLVGLYSVDAAGHHYGTQSKEVELMYRQFALFMDDFVNLLKTRGLHDKTYIVVASDHGMHDTSRFYDIDRYLANKGFKVRPGKSSRNIVAIERGIASAQIYTKGNTGWLDIPTSDYLRNFPTKNGNGDLFETLIEHPGTDIIAAYENENQVNIFSARGEGVLKHYPINGTDYISYQYDKTKGDPLGYNKNPKLASHLNGSFYPSDWWGANTYDETYPDAPTQLTQIFADGRSGNVWISASKDWVFRKKKPATHGSLRRDDMRVILATHGPTIQKNRGKFIRLINIYPMVMKWFGLETDSYKTDEPTAQKLANLLDTSTVPVSDWATKSLIEGEITRINTANTKLTGIQDSLPNREITDKKLDAIFEWQIKRQLEINNNYLKKLQALQK